MFKDYKSVHSWVGGLLLAFPMAYPAIPYYVLSFIVFISMLLYFPSIKDLSRIYTIVLAIAIAILSNIVSPRNGQLDLFRSLYTSFYFAFFVFGILVPRKEDLLRGFLFGVNIISVLVLFFAFKFNIFQYGMNLLSVPEYRLWGVDIFPDWPNFLALFLTAGFLLNICLFRRPMLGAINLFAAFLTTSRTPFLALAVLAVWLFFRLRTAAKISLLVVTAIALIGLFSLRGNGNLMERLLLVSDRQEIYGYALQLFMESPILGAGSILMDKSVGHLGFASYHNSYLDILVRHGVVGFALFIALIYPRQLFRSDRGLNMIPVILIFLLGSFLQNFLKHPHLLMMYSVFISFIIESAEQTERYE